jgi:hypothetical protein
LPQASRVKRCAGPELEIEDLRDGTAGLSFVAGRMSRHGARSLDPRVKIEAELESAAAAPRFLEEDRGAKSVGTNTSGPTLADLHTGRRQLDQSLEQLGGRSPP